MMRALHRDSCAAQSLVEHSRYFLDALYGNNLPENRQERSHKLNARPAVRAVRSTIPNRKRQRSRKESPSSWTSAFSGLPSFRPFPRRLSVRIRRKTDPTRQKPSLLWRGFSPASVGLSGLSGPGKSCPHAFLSPYDAGYQSALRAYALRVLPAPAEPGALAAAFATRGRRPGSARTILGKAATVANTGRPPVPARTIGYFLPPAPMAHENTDRVTAKPLIPLRNLGP